MGTESTERTGGDGRGVGRGVRLTRVTAKYRCTRAQHKDQRGAAASSLSRPLLPLLSSSRKPDRSARSLAHESRHGTHVVIAESRPCTEGSKRANECRQVFPRGPGTVGGVAGVSAAAAGGDRRRSRPLRAPYRRRRPRPPSVAAVAAPARHRARAGDALADGCLFPDRVFFSGPEPGGRPAAPARGLARRSRPLSRRSRRAPRRRSGRGSYPARPPKALASPPSTIPPVSAPAKVVNA